MPQNSPTDIADRIRHFHALLPEGVTLLAVSKFHPLPSLQTAYSAGQRLFGESRADELTAKAAAMPPDCRWHFIGHVQTNKLRRIIAAAHVIESVDSERLLRLISAEAQRQGKVIGVFLQVHVAAEETKTGFTPGELLQCARDCHDFPGIEILGVMGMATNTDNADRIAADFAAIARTASLLRQIVPTATRISMGMSGDWPAAVAAGSTDVRIGTDIFGHRQ